jgi:hypothetical protein
VRRIIEDKIASFVGTMRLSLSVLSRDTAFCRACLRSIVKKIEVDDMQDRYYGRRTVLEHLVMSGGAIPPAALSLIRKWRTTSGDDTHYV